MEKINEKMNLEQLEYSDLETDIEERNKINEQIKYLTERLERRNDKMFAKMEQMIDFDKIPMLQCNSTDHKGALPSDEYFVLTAKKLPDNIGYIGADSKREYFVTTDDKQIEIPEDADFIPTEPGYDCEDYYNHDTPGGKKYLFKCLTENPEMIKRYLKDKYLPDQK